MLQPAFITIDDNRVNTIGGKQDVNGWKGVCETLHLERIASMHKFHLNIEQLVKIWSKRWQMKITKEDINPEKMETDSKLIKNHSTINRDENVMDIFLISVRLERVKTLRG